MAFKIGDRVVVIKTGRQDLTNKVATIKGVFNEPNRYAYCLEFDEFIDGHDCSYGYGPICKDGYGRFSYKTDILQLIPQENIKGIVSPITSFIFKIDNKICKSPTPIKYKKGEVVELPVYKNGNIFIIIN